MPVEVDRNIGVGKHCWRTSEYNGASPENEREPPLRELIESPVGVSKASTATRLSTLKSSRLSF